MTMFIHFFCLCPLSLTIKLNFDISKVAYSKLISNFSENEIESKHAEFKTSAVINIMNNLFAQTRTLNY